MEHKRSEAGDDDAYQCVSCFNFTPFCLFLLCGVHASSRLKAVSSIGEATELWFLIIVSARDGVVRHHADCDREHTTRRQQSTDQLIPTRDETRRGRHTE